MENHEFLWTQVKTECISPPTLTNGKRRKMSFMVEKPGWPTLTEGLILIPSAMDEARLCADWDTTWRTWAGPALWVCDLHSTLGWMVCCCHLEILNISKQRVCVFISFHFALSPAGPEQASLLWYSCQRGKPEPCPDETSDKPTWIARSCKISCLCSSVSRHEVPEDWGTVSCGRRLMYWVLWLERMLLKQLVTLDWGLSLDSSTVPLVTCPSWRLRYDCVQGCSAWRTSTLNYLGVTGHHVDLKQFREGSSLYFFGNLPLCLRWFQTRKSDGGVELGEMEDLFDQVTFDQRAERNGGPSHWGSGGRAFLAEGTECAKALRRGMPGVFPQKLGGRYSDQKVTLWESDRWRGHGGNGNQSKVPVRILGFETHWGEGAEPHYVL